VDGVVDEKELLSGKGVDQINFFKLVNYLQESKLARRVESYAIHTSSSIPDQVTKSNPAKVEPTTPVLHYISSLLSALTHPSKEGRLFFSKSGSTPADTDGEAIALKFLLLDPSSHFQEIVSSARAVILAGGTMSPMSDYTSHLFPYLPRSSITTLSCGHVIPNSNLVAWNLSSGPSGKGSEFEFIYKNRANETMIEELGRALLNICSVVPDGVVVFFPSYSYLETITSLWARAPNAGTGNGDKSVWRRLEAKKVLFREKREESVDSVLEEYGKAIDAGKGGLLLSVVGGKMSEGINFSDRLGRCVVIVGLPFPNIMSAEWKAKMEYIEAATLAHLRGSEDKGRLDEAEMMKQAKEQGRQFYENACMRAVNQSVGRAIRHREDYAAIVMIDKRYSNERIKSKLPGWIREGLVSDAGEKTFGQLMGSLAGFFRSKKGA
jgi:chromosome transmission fidelity protein 1